MTSELESTSLGDSDEDDTMSRYGSTDLSPGHQPLQPILSSFSWPHDHLPLQVLPSRPPDRFSSSTEQSSASRLLKRHRRRRKQRPPRLERVRGCHGTLEKLGAWALV